MVEMPSASASSCRYCSTASWEKLLPMASILTDFLLGICSSGKKEQYAHTNHYISILLHCNQYDKKQTLFRQANA